MRSCGKVLLDVSRSWARMVASLPHDRMRELSAVKAIEKMLDCVGEKRREVAVEEEEGGGGEVRELRSEGRARGRRAKGRTLAPL